jgi:hypothetical protein
MAVTLISKPAGRPRVGTRQRLVCQFAWTRLGLLRFTRRIDKHLDEGWRIKRLSFDTGLLGLRWLCRAVLSRPK